MNTVKWHNNWKEGRNRAPVEAGAQEHGADTNLLCQGSCRSRPSCKTGFGCNDLQINACDCFYHPAFPCTLRQLSHPFTGNKPFPSLWGMQRKGTISSSTELSWIISNKFPDTVQGGRNRWEKQKRISWDCHSSKPCIPIVPLHIHQQHQAEAPGEDLEKF